MVGRTLGVKRLHEVNVRFRKQQRVRKHADFRAAFDQRKSVASHAFVIYARPNEQKVARLGLCVSRRYGNAVARNRWKRQVRDLFRQRQAELPNGYDFIVLPRSNRRPGRGDFERIVQLFQRAAEKAGRY